MLDTLAYCLGFNSRGLAPVAEDSPNFKIKEAEDQWTLIDLKDSESEDENEESSFQNPVTLPQTTKLESSWLITPPPCFDAEDSQPLVEQSPRENLLIEHPSIFVCTHFRNEKVHCSLDAERAKSLVLPLRRRSSSLHHIKIIQSRSTSPITSRSCRHNNHYKRSHCDVFRRNNKTSRKMRQILKQPRKHC